MEQNVNAHRTLVVHVSTMHPWNDNRVFGRECRSLARAGHTVMLIASAQDSRREDGVTILPTPRVSGRVLRMTFGGLRAFLLARRYPADVYHLHDPELIPLIPLFRMTGAKVIYDAHEDLPQQVRDKRYARWTNRSALVVAAHALCMFANYTSSHVVAATPRVAQRFSPAKTTVIYNYPELLPDVDAVVDYAARECAAIYVGAVSQNRGATQMVDAFESAELDRDWKLVIAGPHRPENMIDDLRGRPGWARVDYRGRVDPLVARRLTANARIGLVVLQRTAAYVDALPTKLFEYLAAGIPVIASDFPLWRDIVATADCGLLVDPANTKEIAAALRRLAGDPQLAKAMGERGRRAVQTQFSWVSEDSKLRNIYTSLLGTP